MKPNYKGKTVEVKRHFHLIQMAQDDPEVQAWMGTSFRAIGPYFEHGGKSVATGLSFEEQKVLLPIILGIENNDKDFRRAVTDYYHSILTRVPKDGVKLQISLENDSEPLSATNLPINIQDYIAYRHLINHPQVAASESEAKTYYTKHFYIVDQDKLSKQSLKINDIEDKAMSLYMKYKSDTVKTDQILVMLGIDINRMTHEDKVLALKQAATKNEKLTLSEQAALINKFIQVCEDKNLEYKYLITEMIGARYLKRVGKNIVFAETGEKVGEDMEDAVLYFKNPKNSKEALILKAKYELLVKKGTEYLPNEENSTVQAQ